MIIKSNFPDIKLPEVSFPEYVLQRIERYADSTALTNLDNGELIAFRELHQLTMRCAAALYTLGLRKSDVVMMVSVKFSEYFAIALGVMACGAILTGCKPAYATRELEQQIINSSPKFIFSDVTNARRLRDLQHQYPRIKEVYLTHGSSPGFTGLQELISGFEPRDYPSNIEIDTISDTAFMPYSSGTTGMPKGVMLTHSNLVAFIEITRFHFPLFSKDGFYTPMPFIHVSGFGFVLAALCSGSHSFYHDTFDINQMIQAMQNNKITKTLLVPSMLVALSNVPNLSERIFPYLECILTGGAAFPPSVGKKMKRILSLSVKLSYGLSECIPVCYSYHENSFEMVGYACANTQLKLVDENGKELGLEQVGEVCAKGPQVMKGYFKQKETTAETLDDDGWLHTGDLGCFDVYGCLQIMCRKKELIKYNGKNVIPTESEFILMTHPQIAEAAVAGIPDPESVEIPKGFIVRKDSSLSEQDVHDFLGGKVDEYKYLRGGVSFVKSIPKNATGKILRRNLQDFAK